MSPTGKTESFAGGIMVVTLPRPTGCSLLKQASAELKDTVLSVRVQRDGGMDELAALLRTQRPRKLVLSSPQPITSRDMQRMTDVAFRHCPDVSVVGSYAHTHWNETFTVHISGAVRNLHIMDSNPLGSMRGTNMVLFGAMDQLDLLTISADCKVTIAGSLAPTTRVCIRARTLTMNGYRVPVVEHPDPTASDKTYMFTSVPCAAMPPPMPPPFSPLGAAPLGAASLPMPMQHFALPVGRIR